MEYRERTETNAIQLGIISTDFLNSLNENSPNENSSLLINNDDSSNDNNANNISLGTETLYTAQIIDPVALQFIPQGSWVNKNVSLQYLADNYFSRKNNVTRRFEHKLWNALKITTAFPSMIKHVGVVWVTNTIFKCYKQIFAKLLNISCIDGGLFHKQGNFTRHGFVYVPENILRQQIPENQIQDLDQHDIVVLFHKDLTFTAQSNEDTINKCKWNNPNGIPRVAFLKTNLLPPQLIADDI